MKFNKKIFSFFCCLVVCLSITCTPVYAVNDLNDYNTDTTSGWSLKSSKSHRGSKVNHYKYASTDIEKTYSSDFDNAISLWGTNISLSKTTSTGYGVITTENNDSSTAVATTSGLTYSTSIGHYNSAFTITINTAKYDKKTATLKKYALAHEIGHVYGLSHFSDTSKIMNPSLSTSMTISTTDLAGLKTCTHAHTHTKSTTYTYESYSNLRHKSRCKTCKAYILENHSFNTNNVCKLCGYSK